MNTFKTIIKYLGIAILIFQAGAIYKGFNDLIDKVDRKLDTKDFYEKMFTDSLQREIKWGQLRKIQTKLKIPHSDTISGGGE